jgi:hypothetical protein
MDIANDKNRKRVSIDEADPNQTYFCPECDAALIQKRGEIKVPHFSHKPYEACPDTWTYGNNAWRSTWLRRFPSEYWEIRIGEPGDRHCADLVFFHTAVLFGIGRVSAKDFRQRTDFFHSKGYAVIWVFDLSVEYEQNLLTLQEGQSNLASWDSPYRLFRFNPEDDDQVAFYFDLGTIDDKKEPTLIRPFGHLQPFGSFDIGDPLSASDFVDLVKRDLALKKPDYFRRDLHDNLPRAMDFSFKDVIYGCPSPDHPDHFVAYSSCSTCPNCQRRDGDKVFCTYRLRDLKVSEIAQVLRIKRAPNGLLDEADVIQHGTIKHYCWNPEGYPLWTLPEIWEKAQSGFKTLSVLNSRNHHRFYLLSDPVKALKEDKPILGYLDDDPPDLTKGTPLTDGSEPIWLLEDVTYPPKPKPVYRRPEPSYFSKPIVAETPAPVPTGGESPKLRPMNELERSFWEWADSYFTNPEIERLRQQLDRRPPEENHDLLWWNYRREELVGLTKSKDYSFQFEDLEANRPFKPCFDCGPEGQKVNAQNKILFLRKIKPFLSSEVFNSIEVQMMKDEEFRSKEEWTAKTNQVIQDQKL